jgi:hypothetical protein
LRKGATRASPSAGCPHHVGRTAVGAADAGKLDRQVFGARGGNLGAASEYDPRLCEGVDQHARADAGEIVQAAAHGGHDAEVSAAAAQCPEQLRFIGLVGDDNASISEHDLCGQQIVERQAEASDQWPVAAAQGEPGHADGAARARHGRDAKRIRHGRHVGSARASRNHCATAIGSDGHPVHAAEIDDDAGAQRAAGPVVPAAPHRQGESAIAGRSNGRLDIVGRPAVDDRARQRAHRLRPDRGRGGIAVLTRQRDTAGQLSAKRA